MSRHSWRISNLDQRLTVKSNYFRHAQSAYMMPTVKPSGDDDGRGRVAGAKVLTGGASLQLKVRSSVPSASCLDRWQCIAARLELGLEFRLKALELYHLRSSRLNFRLRRRNLRRLNFCGRWRRRGQWPGPGLKRGWRLLRYRRPRFSKR